MRRRRRDRSNTAGTAVGERCTGTEMNRPAGVFGTKDRQFAFVIPNIANNSSRRADDGNLAGTELVHGVRRGSEAQGRVNTRPASAAECYPAGVLATNAGVGHRQREDGHRATVPAYVYIDAYQKFGNSEVKTVK